MARTTYFWRFIALLLALILTVAAKDGNGCKKGCPKSDSGLLKYIPGNYYEYAFDSILTIGLSSGAVSEADDTSLKVTGSAKVFAEGNCGYTLQVGSVKVTNTKESVEKKILNNIQKPVHFTLVSGQLEPEICSDSNDAAYSLNIKRAIISLLQSGTDSDHEIDVFGQCKTHTSSSKAGNAEVITKVRNLNNCAYREQINSGLVSGVVNEKAGITSSLLLEANYIKELKIGGGVIENVQLVETYRFIGSARGNSEISAKAITSLKLKNPAGTKANAPATGATARSLLFQKPETYTSKNINSLKTILSDLVDSTTEYVKKDSAKKFVEFIRLLRQSDSDTLLELGAFPHPNKVLARKVYLDGLFRTNTAESAVAILKQLSKLGDKEQVIAILSLNLVESVDKNTLNQAASQLSPSAHKELYLSVGSLVAKYCAQHGCQAGEIDLISKKFTDSLKQCKPNTKKEEERIVYILKGIGNAQALAGTTAAALSECASTGRSNRIRVAALQAFSAVTCDPTLQKKSLELLKDHNEDSELRIEAYLSAISCPNAEVANEVSQVVNSENVYQVGGFISSSLKAIRDSTDPTREQQKYHLANIRVTKKFPRNYRRYSFNNELSYKLDALGLSASSDYKLIYSQNGFLPRSSRINVTTEIFGTSFNVFEASVRQENLENILEYYLGPKGLLNKDFDEIVKLIEVTGAGAGAGAGGRARRSIADDAAKTSKKYKTYGSKNKQDLNLDLSLKLFGSELAFLSLGDNMPSTMDDIIRHFSEAFDKAKNDLSSFEKQFASHHLFLDTEFSYPTGVGVPLELTAQGFAANKIDFAVNIDVNAILEQNWQRVKYRLKFVPSIDVNVNVQIGFNAQVLSTGLRVASTAHSATGNDVTVALINDGEGFNVDVELPREKLEIIDVKINTEFFVAEQDKQKSVALKATKTNKNSQPSELCFNQLEIVGFNVCIESSTSLSEIQAGSSSRSGRGQTLIDQFYLSRPFSFGIYLTTERKFNFKGLHSVQPSGSQQWKLDYSTPGSKVSHDTSVSFELGSKPRIYGRLSFDNSQYHFGIETGITNDNKELVVYGQYEQDKDIKKSKIGFSKSGNEYKPLIEIQDKNGVTNSINGYQAEGKIVVQKTSDKQARYNFENFQVSNTNNERIILNGWTDVGPSSVNGELHIASAQQSYLVKGNFKLENGLYAAGLFVNDEHSPENVFGSSAQLTVKDHSYALTVTGKAAAWSIDSDTGFEFEKVDNSNSVRTGTFSQNLLVQHKNKPVSSLSVKSTFDVNKFDFAAEVTGDQKVGSVTIKYQSNQRSVNDYALEVNGKLNKHSVDLLSKCDLNGNHYIVDNIITTSWGTSLTAKGELGQRYTPQDIRIDLQGNVQFSGKDKPTQWTLKVIGTPDKTNSEFRVSREAAELLKLTSESQHPQDKVSAAKVNLIVRNLLTAKSEFKIAKNGKGELSATIESQKSEPKHKLELESKFHIQAPKYDIDTSFTLDGDKKVHFKSENNLDKVKFSTKNSAEASDKKLVFEANGNLKGDWRTNGEVQGTFALTTPDGRVVDGSIHRKVTANVKTGITQGTMDAQINDQPSGSSNKRSVTLKGKLDRLNIRTKEFSANSQIAYTSLDGQKSELSYKIKQQPKGDGKSFDLIISANGNPLSQPIEISVVADEYSTQHATGRIDGKYGELLSANLNGNYNCAQNNVPATYEFQANIQVPKSNLKSVTINSHGRLLRPAATNGPFNVEFFVDAKTGDGQFARVNSDWKGTPQEGSYDFEAQSNNMASPLKLNGNYHREQSGSLKDSDASGKQKYGFNALYGDKYLKTDAALTYNSETATLAYTLDSSYEAAKNIEINIRSQKSVEDSYVVAVQAKQAEKSYGLDMKLYRSAHKKGVDIRVDLSNGPPIILTSIVEVLGERKGKVSLEIENLVDLDFKLNSEASYVSVDDFYIVGSWRSKKLKLDDYELDVRAQGKSIKAQLKNIQGLVFLGTATYALKKEQSKAIIEGQGQVQYQGKSHSGNFKLTRQHFDLNNDKEIGFSYTFNGNFGPKNGVSTLKITNKEFNTKFSLCEEKKQCANVQLQSIVNIEDQQVDSVQHSTLVLVDLRELGYPYEFELKSQNTRQGFKYQYHLDSFIISGNNLKYQLTANVQPTSSTVKLSLPKRQILLETLRKIPEGSIFGHYEQSAAFYIDKLQRPEEVVRVSAILDISGVEHVALNAKGQLQVEHPTIRPLSISGHADANREQQIANGELIFDIFHLPEQKIIVSSVIKNTRAQQGFNITTTQQVKSNGLKFQYDLNGHTAVNTEAQEFSFGVDLQSGNGDVKAGAYAFANKEKLEISLDALNEQILRIVGDFNKQKRTAKFNSKLQVFDKVPIEIVSELQPTFAKVSLKSQDLIDANTEIKLGKELKFDISGRGKPLFNGRVALDASNFLQTTYKSNDDDVKAFLLIVEAEVKKHTKDITEKLKQRFEKLRQESEQIVKIAKEAHPDFSKLKTKIDDNLKAIIQELETDPSLAPIIDGIRTIFKKIATITDELAKTTSELYEKVQKSLTEIYEKLQALWNDSLSKAWEDFLVTATELIGQLRVEIINVYTKAFQDLLDLLEKYGPALKNYGKAVSEFLKPINEAAQELTKVLVHATEEIIEELKQYASKLPTFESIRTEFSEKIKTLKLVEKTLELVNNLFDQLHILPQTQETSEFLQKLHDYLEAKLKQKSVNDEKLLDELSKLLIKAIRSIWASIESSAPGAAAPVVDVQTWFASLPHSVDTLFKLPALLSFRSSSINYLLNENWEHVFTKDLLKSWVFFNDFELRGHVVDGQHLFTFDGQHYMYPGNCKYILAQDSVDNNFTVIGQLTNGKLKGITVVDRDGNYIEVADTVALKVNGKAVEYPQHFPGIHVWRRFYTIHLYSEYGVNVVCTTDLKVCHVNVNGFYTGKTRGLLGNGNAEPYDDYLQVDGTLAANSALLGNDYGVGKCAAVAFNNEQIDSQRRDEICDEIFGIESPLALNYLTLDSKPYRRACDIALEKVVEKEKEAAACTFALAYGSAIKQINKWVLLPPRCLKCAGAPGQRELADEFTVKLPNTKADLVFVVDINVTPAVLGSLISPAITEIRESLKSRGFTDVQIGVIIFDESKRYPALLTSDSGKINYKGNVANVQLNGPKRFCDNCVEQIITEKKVLDIYNALERLVKGLVPQSDEKAFHLALDYPFRAGAAKSIIGVRSDSLEYKNWWKFVRAQITEGVTKFDGALLHLIAPVKALSLDGVPAEKLVGFNSRLIATLDGKDNKKRPKLQFESDMGIDFVLNNGGWVFATQNFDNLKAPEQRKFLNQITSSIADTLFKTEVVSDCRCLPVHGLHGQHKCIIKSSSFIPNKKPKAA
ncbi:apolipophorins [Drosophila pseudoobscura]|uniref:Apolipophorins n=1 Tax=Drosophila pseudoobscura pseudoobscura TaxID=46245 RepID=Q29CT0_DROPS|nr:apolipophorins [Drosophila pseudoobscura]XP_015044443.1 apolipophorins [Drosophila pseudoobscura]